MAHFDEMTCLQYLDGALDAARSEEFRAHTGGCRECAALLRALQRESLWLQSAMQEAEEAVPARLLNPAAKEKLPWLWMTLLGFASAGVWTLWSTVSSMMDNFGQAGFDVSTALSMAVFQSSFWSGWGDVMDFMQIAAALTLGVPAVWLLWRHRRRMSPASMVLATAAGMLLLPSGAAAAELDRGKQSYTLAADQTIKDDLIVMSGNVRIDGTVDGDLIVFAQSVSITGHVTGDVIVFTQRLRVEGQVDGDIRTFVNTLTIEGKVAKNVMVFGETIETIGKSQVDGSLTAFAKTLTFDGRTGRDLTVFGDNITLNGFSGADVMAAGKHLSVGDSAEIVGKAEWRSTNEPEVSAKAKLASAFVVTKPVRKARYADPGYYIGELVKLGVSFIFGLALLLMMPQFFREAVGAARQFGPALGFGAISLIVAPILALIACITIVGLAVGIGGLMMYLIALYSAKVVVGTWLGAQLLGKTTTTGGLIGRMALGLLILRVATMVPYGGWVTFAYCIFGLGAITLAIYNRMRSTPPLAMEPAAAAAPAPAAL